MTLIPKLAAAGLALTLAAAPVAADPGSGKGHGKWQGHGQMDRRGDLGRHDDRYRADFNCPPGLAKKNPPCVPPGQARKSVDYGTRVGSILGGDYIVIRDPRRYDLPTQPGWSYYRDDRAIYRVDSETRKIIAVLNLIDAFSN